MIRKSLDVRTPQKSTGTNIRTPSRKINVSTKGTLKVAEATVSHGEVEAEAKSTSNVVPTSDKKRSNSPQIIASDVMTPAKNAANKSEASSPQTRQRVTPQRFNASDDVERICTPTLKSPVRRRSKEATPAKQHDKVISSPHNKNSPGVMKKGVANKRKSAELVLDSPAPHMKKKRVSFGGYLVPELFDKKMPPDSPLRKGENPRRSLCRVKPKQSLLRRASVIGLLNVAESPTKKSSRSPNVSVRNSPKGRSPSSKEPSPGKKTPKPRTPSPHKKSPKSTPAKSPRPNTPSAKASLSVEKSSESRSSSEKSSPRTPLPKSGKSTPTSPKWPSPVIKSLKPNTPSAIVSMSREKSPKSRSSPASSENTSGTPSPKSPKSTPASPKWVCLTMKSPKLNTQSAKASLSGEKSPKWRSSYPPSSEKTSKLSTPRRPSSSSNKFETPLAIGLTCKETPTSTKRTSPRLTAQGNGNKTPVKAPQGTQMNISSVQGRFSVSRIETPTPMAEAAIVDPVQSAMVIPKIPLQRKSMKTASRKTPLAKSAIKVMIRRSGISRASMKAMISWADTVRFGQVKVQAAVSAKKTVKSIVTTTKVVKKKVSRPQTPLRKQLGHASTGHADSPVTIVVGQAFKQKVSHPTGAAPKVIFNTVISKKNMKMDEDLSGISEMFTTPVKEVARKLETSSTTKTPLLVNEPAVLEPSVLNTPEEPGEMVVSPLTLASTAKAGRYNKEAVKRLLNGSQESSFNNFSSGMEIKEDSVEQQYTGTKASDVTTPKQKQQPSVCLTGVRRLMKTPRQKAEPVEDLRGKLLKTPKQKPEQQECLTGVKRIMRTPRQKIEPVGDLRGKLLKTPKQKSEEKRILTTPTASEHINLQWKLLPTPKETEVADVSFSGIADLLETPAKDSHNLVTPAKESQDLPEQTNSATPKVSNSPIDCFAGIKKVMKTPKQRSAPFEGILGIERLMKTPKVRSEPVEDNFGTKQLMKSPRLRGSAPLEDFEALQELIEEPVEFKDHPASSYLDEEKDFIQGQPEDKVSSGVTHDTPQLDISREKTEVLVEVPSVACESLEAKKAVSQAVSEAAPGVTEMHTASIESANSKKSVQGRRAKIAEPKVAEPVSTESSEGPVVTALLRGRRGKKVDSTEPPAEEAIAAPKTKRGRYAKKVETVQQAAPETLPEPESEQSLPVDIEPVMKNSVAPLEKEAVKPKRGRYAKKALEQIETFLEAANETLMEPDSEPTLPENIEPPISDSVALLEKVAVRPKRGRCAKKASEQIETIAEAATETLPEPKGEQTLPVDIESAMNKSVAPLEKEAVKSKRGRYAKKALEQTETIPVAATLPELDIEPAVTDNVAPLEEAVKAKRGRKPKQFSHCKQAQSSACSDVSQDNTPQDNSEGSGDRQGQMPSEHHENKSSDSAKSLPEFKTATERDITVVQKSSVRGRRGKLVENTAEEEKQDTAFEEALVSAPVRARRGKRIEATAPPAGRQTTRNRNAKTKKDACDAQSVMVPEKDMELNLVTGTSETHTSQDDVRMSDEDLVNKSSRGRRAKHTPVEPPQPKLEKTLEIEQPSVSVQPQLPAPTNKKGRGRKVISETVELEEHEKDEIISEETKHQSKPLARTRGRNAKHKEELDNSDKTSVVAQSVLQELIKTSREQTVDVENPVQVQAEAPQVSEPEQMSEHTSSSTKTRRGVVRKLKQEAVTPGSAENQDSPIETPTEKPKRGRRAKQVEDGTTSEVPEETDIATRRVVRKPKQEVTVESVENHDGPIETLTEKPKRGRRAKQVEDVTTSEVKEKPEPQQKPQRGRGLKTNLKNEMPQVVPAKRARRGSASACEEAKEVPVTVPASAPVTVPESAPASLEPVKRGRLQNPVRSVKWNLEVGVHELPKRPVRAVRGKRSSPGDHAVTLSQSESENADKTEEDLSEKAVEPQPAKRPRRGTKVANETQSTSEVATKEAKDTPTQPKTRKGRSTKK